MAPTALLFQPPSMVVAGVGLSAATAPVEGSSSALRPPHITLPPPPSAHMAISSSPRKVPPHRQPGASTDVDVTTSSPSPLPRSSPNARGSLDPFRSVHALTPDGRAKGNNGGGGARLTAFVTSGGVVSGSHSVVGDGRGERGASAASGGGGGGGAGEVKANSSVFSQCSFVLASAYFSYMMAESVHLR